MRRQKDTLPDLRYDFYAAAVRTVTIGPRREITLRVQLSPFNRGQVPDRGRGVAPDCVDVRFGDIDDFDRVATFFRELAGSVQLAEGLHYFRHASTSRLGRFVIEMQWDRTDAEMRLTCSSLRISDLFYFESGAEQS